MACGKNFKAYLVGSFSAIGGFLFGYHTGVISGILNRETFLKQMKIDPNNIGIQSGIVGILLFGCFVGSLIGGQTSDRFSRKYSIGGFSIIFTIGAALQTGSRELILFFFGRFVSGISIGALSMIVPVYHSEIAETRVRGRIITLQQLAVTIGIAISYWINFGIFYDDLGLNSEKWRIPLGFQIVPSLILSIGILFCPFSPRWLISHDREDEARDVLIQIRSASHDEIEEEMERIKSEVAYLRENEIESYRQLFRVPLVRPFLLGIGIQILQQLTGINATIYYAPQIFKQLFTNNTNIFNNSLETSLLFATGIYGCVNVLATIPTIIFIDKLGRRILLISGSIIMSLSMMIISILDKQSREHSSPALIIMIYIFVAAFAYSWGPIAWVYCAEIFPLTMRAKATSLTTAANWVTNCVISFVALALLQNSSSAIFITFALFCTIMIGIIYFFYPETKNIHLEENNIGETNRIFVPQWLELRRRNYNTLESND